MDIQKFYLENLTQYINNKENRYDFFDLGSEDCQASAPIDKLCLKNTQQIAKARKQQKPTQKIEKILKAYRDCACNDKA